MNPGGTRHRLLPGLLAGALLAAYAAAAHYTSLQPEGSAWALLLAGGPILAMALDFVRRSLGTGALLVAAPLAVAAAWQAWPLLLGQVSGIYFAQHVGVNAGLGLLFAGSLQGGRQPLCTFFATFLYPALSPAVVRYTRRITAAWAAFFFAIAAASILLFCFAPREAWSVFANLLGVPLVGGMFLAEYLVSRRVLPPEDRLTPTGAFRAWRAASRSRQGARPGDWQP